MDLPICNSCLAALACNVFLQRQKKRSATENGEELANLIYANSEEVGGLVTIALIDVQICLHCPLRQYNVLVYVSTGCRVIFHCV